MIQLDNTTKYKMEADFLSSFYDIWGQGKNKEDTAQNFLVDSTSYFLLKNKVVGFIRTLNAKVYKQLN